MLRPVVSIVAVLLAVAHSATADELEVLRHRLLTARPEALRAVTRIGDSLPLRLFDDAQYNARLVSLEDDPLNGFVWRGWLEDTPGGWVVLVEDNGCMAGTVAAGDAYFRILCVGGGRHVIEEVRPPEPLLDDALFVAPADDAGPLEAPLESPPEDLDGDQIVDIDVLVVYTRKAARKLFREYDAGFRNKKQQMKTYIKLAIALGNTALENSDVNIRLRLVKSRPIGYRATGDSTYDLEVLQDPNDGIIDRVHAWRDQYGADFVSMVLDDFEPEWAGLGYFAAPSASAENWMFSVVIYDALWWYTLVHELGHNMGLAHDRDNSTVSEAAKSFPYSHGYRDPVGGFITVMSYFDGCEECRWKIPHFSNRKIRWQGAPTGLPTYELGCGDGVTSGPKCGRRTGKANADNARSLNNTREFYAEVRPCQVDCG